MSTKLFKVKDVKKFFNILQKLERACCERYKGYFSKDYSPCEQEVFVNRTINKWLKHKYLILYTEGENISVEFKKYLSIVKIEFALTYGKGDLTVYVYDFSRPVDLYKTIKVNHNIAIDMEGEWCEDNKRHTELLKFFTLDIPDKEYVFKTYDLTKTKKKKFVESTITFKAKTEKHAWKQREKHQKYNKDLVITPELIEVKYL